MGYSILGIYLITINVLGYVSMSNDKKKAIKKAYRTPEKTLFLIALLGGALGSLIGMQVCRHKTKHWYFQVGIPAILVIQIIAIGVCIDIGLLPIS